MNVRHSATNGIFGGTGGLSVHNPYVYKSDEFSLGQIGIIGLANGEFRQTVEAGWQVCPACYPAPAADADKTRFFTFFTTNAYQGQGADYVQSYNTKYKGFVQTGTTMFPGKIIMNPGGAPFEQWLAVKYWYPGWWVWFAGEWVGYYPANLFNELSTSADVVVWQGEVRDQIADGVTTRTDMGAGSFPVQHQAWFRGLSTYVSSAGATVPFGDNGGTASGRTGCWEIEKHINQADPWGGPSWFWYGGPGYTGTTCP